MIEALTGIPPCPMCNYTMRYHDPIKYDTGTMRWHCHNKQCNTVYTVNELIAALNDNEIIAEQIGEVWSQEPSD